MQIREVGQVTGQLSSSHKKLPRYLANCHDGFVYAIGKDVYSQLRGMELLSGDAYNIILIEKLEVSFVTSSILRFIAYPDGYTTSVRTMVRNIIRIDFFPPI